MLNSEIDKPINKLSQEKKNQSFLIVSVLANILH